jgi:L-lactate dehydrogenase complex protein LldF
VLTPALKGLADWKELPAASSLCGACRDVCPVRLDLPRMLLRLRYRSAQERRAPWSLRLAMKAFAWSASRPAAYRALARLVRRGLRWRARGGWVRSGPWLLGGWTRVRDLPAPAATTFQDRWRARGASRAGDRQ